MTFIKSMTCYAQHSSKGIRHYNKVLIVHWSCYHGYRKKEQPNSSVPRDSRLSRLCRGVQLYPHGRTGLTTIPHAWGKGCLRSPNLSLIWPECPLKKVRAVAQSMSRTFLTDAKPLASFTDKPVVTSYLACRPHPRHVVCTGSYSDLRILLHGPYCSMSYVVWDPTLTTIYPSHEQDI